MMRSQIAAAAAMLFCIGAEAFAPLPAVTTTRFAPSSCQSPDPRLRMATAEKQDEECDVHGCYTVDDDNAPAKTSTPPSGRTRRALNRAVGKVIGLVPGLGSSDSRGDLSAEDITDELFGSLDADKDGYVSREELSAAGLAMGAIDALDENKDSKISREEMLSAVGAVQDAKRVNGEGSDVATQDIMDELEDTLGELEPLERQELRLGGFEPYILVSVLTAQASFEAIGETDVGWDEIAKRIEAGSSFVEVVTSIDWFSMMVLLTAAGSTVAGMYATVVFSLCILYGKTALGMSRDDEYYAFMDATGLQRFRAFQAFSWTLGTFSATVLLLLCEHAPEPIKIPLAALSAYALYFGKQEYDAIMEAAQPIFAPRATPDKSDKRE